MLSSSFFLDFRGEIASAFLTFSLTMGFLLKLKSCFCPRTVQSHADDVSQLSKDVGKAVPVKGLNEDPKISVKGLKEDPKASSTKLSGQMDGMDIARRNVFDDDSQVEGSIASTHSNQRGLVEESIARTDSYQNMLAMLHVLSMGGGQHGSIEEVIQELGEEIQEEENDDMKDAFNFFDADRNGSISASDLHIALLDMGENASIEECRLMVQAVSRTNGDNSSVAFADFQRLLVEA